MNTSWRITLLAVAALAANTTVAHGQEARLAGRLGDSIRQSIDAVLDSARADALPTEPLVDRALEGAAKRAPEDRILAAVRRLWGELATARDALGIDASTGELTAGASAIRAGATREDLGELRTLRGGQPLTVAAATLADLVAVGVPADTAIAAVLALAVATDDGAYLAFRRNVERDIALGASPVAALGFRLSASADAIEAAAPGTTGASTPRRRKP